MIFQGGRARVILRRVRICTAVIISQLVVTLLALAVPADVAIAQVRPEQRPPPLPKRKPKVRPPAPPPATPVLSDVKYLAPEEAPDFGKAPKRYRAPNGFAGHPWGQPRVTFDRLPEEPLMVRAAWTRGHAPQPEMFCTAGIIGGVCNVNDILNSITVRYDGGGFHVLSEYKIEEQGFRFSESGVVLHPVIYQFCANWDSTKKEVPKNFDELNQFCGMRLLFETESRAQLRELPADHVTKYDLVLSELIAEYGKPSGFLKHGRVTIEVEDDPADRRSAEDRKFSTWRWCPAADRALSTHCDASIVMSLDPDSGRAVVLFSTPALWQYAYARQHSNEGGDPLFAVMHARKP
jgi:hypothetical protein